MQWALCLDKSRLNSNNLVHKGASSALQAYTYDASHPMQWQSPGLALRERNV